MTEQELKPCPFCGEQKYLIISERYGHKVITCDNCGASGAYAGQSGWNTRVLIRQHDKARYVEAIDLIIFLAGAWDSANDFIMKHCTGVDAIGEYPIVQGTKNQLDLKTIGQQQYDQKNVRAAVDSILDRIAALDGASDE